MLKSSGAMGAATIISRVLGLVREIAYAAFLGIGWVADAFFLAFTIPNLFRRLLGEGALTAAFIPIFAEKEKTAGEGEMWRAANAVVSGLVISAAGIAGLCVGALAIITSTGAIEGKTLLMLRLLEVMFPYFLLVCVVAIFQAMLNARGYFFVPALGAGLLNIVMIASVLWLAPHVGERRDQQVFGLAIGVLIAGIIQAAFQWPLLYREGFHYKWIAPWRDDTVREVARRMIPGAIGVAAFQINVLVTKCLAFGVETGVVSSFDYAVRLMELPQGIFGISLATYLLPTLSGLFAEKKYDDFRSTLSEGLGYLVFVNLLASVLLLTLAEPMVRLLFERRSFDNAATARTTSALVALAPGLIAFSAVNILARAFYATGDTRTPMKISVFCLALNVVLTMALVWPLKQAGLGIANSCTSVINAALLSYALRRKMKHLNWGGLRQRLPGLFAAALVSGMAAWAIGRFWETRVGCENLLQKAGHVLFPMLAATAIYFLIAAWLKLPYVAALISILRSPKK